MAGASMMLELYADNLDTPLVVSFLPCNHVVKIVVFYWGVFVFTGATYYMNAYFGQGSGPIFMGSVGCGSSDTALLACSYDPDTSEDNHEEDAGVRCGGKCINSH